jgi:hypothetical protein
MKAPQTRKAGVIDGKKGGFGSGEKDYFTTETTEGTAKYLRIKTL